MRNIDKLLYAVLEPRHGQPYTNEKVAEIKGMQPAQVLEWSMVHLDPQNRSAFFSAVGIDISAETSSTLRRAFDAMRRANS